MKTRQLSVNLDLCLQENSVREIRRLSQRNRFRKAQFSFVHANTKSWRFKISFGLSSVFEKFRFRDGLLGKVDLAIETKLRFQIILA